MGHHASQSECLPTGKGSWDSGELSQEPTGGEKTKQTHQKQGSTDYFT